MAYVDGFVLAVPTANREAYIAQTERFARFIKENGAIQYVEAWGDDVPEGEVTSFSLATKRKEDETVVFSWVLWPSKQVRVAAWEKMMSDPAMQEGMANMPFDAKRMFWGGFTPIVEV